MRALSPLDPSLAEAYQASLGAEKIRLTRVVTALAISLHLAIMLLDYWLAPSAFAGMVSVRVLMILISVACLVCTWHPGFLRHYDAIVGSLLLCLGFGVSAAIMLAASSEAVYHHYYGGLLLITFGQYVLTYLSLPVSLGISTLLLGSYLLVGRQLPIEILSTSLFFFVSTTAIGLVAFSLRESYSIECFLLRHALQKDVLRKHQEAEWSAHLAEHDPLTGLPNRLRFFKEANALLGQAQANDTGLAVLFIDLDGFKPINDLHGHSAGDRVLKVVAKRLRECLRTEDVAARLGGDEFVACLVVEDAHSATVQAVVRHVTKRLEEEIHTREQNLQVTVSVGIALYPADGTELETLIQRADEDMYRVKSGPRQLLGGYS